MFRQCHHPQPWILQIQIQGIFINFRGWQWWCGWWWKDLEPLRHIMADLSSEKFILHLIYPWFCCMIYSTCQPTLRQFSCKLLMQCVPCHLPQRKPRDKMNHALSVTLAGHIHSSFFLLVPNIALSQWSIGIYRMHGARGLKTLISKMPVAYPCPRSSLLWHL